MKRKPIVFAAAVAAIFLAVPTALFAMPRNVLDALNEAQDEELVAGAGVSDVRHLPTARSVATIEARADIARTLQNIVDTWQEYQAALDRAIGNDGDSEMVEILFDTITETIARSTFPGSRTIFEYRAADGHYWVVMTISRANAEAVVVSAVTNAEAAIAADPVVRELGTLERGRLASEDALERMDRAFNRHFEN
ncbi:MAG: hypothetical protein FWB78_11080 [Treponema sp.]|nr:hypothetical protein [Treponema sp.]